MFGLQICTSAALPSATHGVQPVRWLRCDAGVYRGGGNWLRVFEREFDGRWPGWWRDRHWGADCRGMHKEARAAAAQGAASSHGAESQCRLASNRVPVQQWA